ncbi:hypothetical protein SMICM17S_12315 [Streptomyces microflavus]
MHVVRAVAHAGRDDDVVRVELPVLVTAAVGGEGAPRGAAPLTGAVDVGLDGLDVDKVGRLGAVAALALVLAVARVLTIALVITLALVVSLALVVALALVIALALILALVLTLAVVLAAVATAVAAVTRVAAVAGGAVVGAQTAPGEAFDPRRTLPDALDRGADAVETRRPLVPQRAEHGVLGEPGVLGYLLLPVGELLVGIGDLGIHRGEFAVDLGACLFGHVGQFVTGIGTVDGGHLATHALGAGGWRTGRPFPRGGVDIDRHQPAPAQDQGDGGGYGPIGQAGAFLAGRTGCTCCVSHGTPLLRGRSVTSHTRGPGSPFSSRPIRGKLQQESGPNAQLPYEQDQYGING